MKSAVLPKDYPPADRVEIGIVGRSNAGKSSLINQLLNKKQAFVSSSPGKTILLNFYDMGKSYRLVDMPGYGFAKRSHKERKAWQEMIETYISTREVLSGVVLVVDIQRQWQQEEQDLVEWCHSKGLAVCIALSKSDKLKMGEKNKKYDYFLKSSQVPCFLISSTKKQGIQELENYLYSEWVKA